MTSGLLLSQLFRKSDGETINVADIKMSLSKSLVIQAKKVILVALGLDSLEDDFLVYFASSIQNMTAKRQSNSPSTLFAIYCPANCFLFWRVNLELAGLSLSQDSSKMSWEGIIQTTANDEVIVAFWQWYKCCNKGDLISNTYIEKSWEINTFLTLTVVFELNYSSLVLISLGVLF